MADELTLTQRPMRFCDCGHQAQGIVGGEVDAPLFDTWDTAFWVQCPICQQKEIHRLFRTESGDFQHFVRPCPGCPR